MTTDSKEIRTKADDILRSGLLSILDRHGEVHMVGSYVLGLMTWRDLDIHVARENLDVRAFFDRRVLETVQQDLSLQNKTCAAV